MSFILDALKKLERQKQKEDVSDEDGVVMEGGRRWGETKRRIEFSRGWAVVALVALILAVVALYYSLRVDTTEAPPPQTAGPSSQPEPSGDEALPPAGLISEDTQAPDSHVESPPVSTPPLIIPDTVQESPGEEAAVDHELVPEEDIEAAPPVRLVGRSTEDRPAPEPAVESEDVSEEIPEGLPELVLQGTSVVDGRPVAVVNYKRLFEGDTIEGARVIRISERVVELEYEGKRFIIKL
jgi:hypothetical protein